MAHRRSCSGALFGALVAGVVGVGVSEAFDLDAAGIVGLVTFFAWLLMQLVRGGRSRRG